MINITINKIIELEDYIVNIEVNGNIHKDSNYSFILFDKNDKLRIYRDYSFPSKYEELFELIYNKINNNLLYNDVNLTFELKVKLTEFVLKWFLIIDNVILTLDERSDENEKINKISKN